MRRRALLVAVGALVAAVVTVPLVASGWWGADDAAAGATRHVDLAAPVDPADDESVDDRADGERGGPPPWASSVGRDARDKAPKALSKWKSLTSDQKAALMKRLAAEHEAGMKEFAACREEGRADCVKPLPPGLAKRQ